MSDERRRRLARNLAIALVLAGCSLAQYAAVSRAAPLGTPAASPSPCAERFDRTACSRGAGHIPAHDARGSTPELPSSYWPG